MKLKGGRQSKNIIDLSKTKRPASAKIAGKKRDTRQAEVAVASTVKQAKAALARNQLLLPVAKSKVPGALYKKMKVVDRTRKPGLATASTKLRKKK